MNTKILNFLIIVCALGCAVKEGIQMDSENGRERLIPFSGSDCYFHNSDQVYYRDHLIEQADMQTFTAFPADYDHFQYLTPLAADSAAFYADDIRIVFNEACKARILAPNNSGDCICLFVFEDRLYRINKNDKCAEPVDTDTAMKHIEAVETGSRYVPPLYFRNRKGVYFYDEYDNTFTQLPEADPGSFEGHAASYSFNLYWGKDSRNIYCFSKLIDKADHDSFEYLGWVYAKDMNHVYCLADRKWSIIPEADPQSFAPVKGDGIDAADKDHSYSSGRVVE